VQPKTRQVHIRNGFGCIKARQNVTQFDGMFGNYASRVVVLIETLQPFVAD